MNQDKGKHLAEIIRSLSENLVGEDFELVMLRVLSSLFRPSAAAFVSRETDGGADLIRVVELREDRQRTDMISEADFARRYGFSISHTTSGQTSLLEGFSELPGRLVSSFIIGKCHCLIYMTGIQDIEYLSEEHCAPLRSLIEMALNARYSIKKAMRSMEPDSETIAFSAHRIKTALSSIRTAADMLMDQDLSESDTVELKKLVHTGVIELTELIDRLLQMR
ncbi:MAG TPA: hypothetical protein DCP92_06455 [Nitrospiraceae bacterium]|nr:hypothetical protein [Nitrospiraceae bacterium]